jgi:hypothetical protein
MLLGNEDLVVYEELQYSLRDIVKLVSDMKKEWVETYVTRVHTLVVAAV